MTIILMMKRVKGKSDILTDGIIDLHTHLMPGIDDGARDIQEFIEMAEQAVHGGTKMLVLTPHTNLGVSTELNLKQGIDIIRFLKDVLKEYRIPLELLPGAEIMADRHLAEKMRSGNFMTLNHTQYCLIEFEFDESPVIMEKILDDVTACGFVPVVAHPERYFGIQKNINWIEKWYQKGWIFQINKGSITGAFGDSEEICAHKILERRMASIIASDAHNTFERNPDMNKLYRYIKEVYGLEYAHQLFLENPLRILAL